MGTHRILIKDNDSWLLFENPLSIIQTDNHSEIFSCLEKLQDAISQGRYIAGFLTYEASAAFEPNIPVYTSYIPLLWFGIYDKPCYVSISVPPDYIPPVFKWKPVISEEEYNEKITRIKEYISTGDTYQVNFTFEMKASFEGDLYLLFKNIALNHSSPYASFVDIGSHVICSFSPELFFCRDGSSIRCRPMKGTIKRGINCKEDHINAANLKCSEKNRAENVMIVDMIRNDLGKISEIGSVETISLFDIEKYRSVFQMTSTIQSKSDTSLPELFRALFPCASITGAPKIRTAQIIHELEKGPRNVYCGSIGYATPQNKACFNVAIRTLTYDTSSRSASYNVGSGIIWDSQNEDEYNECLAKAEVISTQYHGFKLLETLLYTKKHGYFLFEEHVHRCVHSATYFDFNVTEDALVRYLNELCKSFPEYSLRVRCIIDKNGNIESYFAPVSTSETPIRVALATAPVNSSDVFLYHKTTNRIIYDKAMQLCPKSADVILWNEKRQLTETTIGNLVLKKNGKLLTPPVRCGLLDGTYRSYLLKRGLLEEAILTIDDVFDCEAIFRINSVRKWQNCIINTPDC